MAYCQQARQHQTQQALSAAMAAQAFLIRAGVACRAALHHDDYVHAAIVSIAMLVLLPALAMPRQKLDNGKNCKVANFPPQARHNPFG